MSLFLPFAVALTLLAIAIAVLPLWRRSRGLALALAVAIPLCAAGLYYFKGTLAALDPAARAAVQDAGMPASMEEAMARLQQRLAANPDDFDGLVLLARSYMAMEKFELAPPLYARALALRPGDSDVSVEYAEALLRTSPEHSFPPVAVRMIEAAVEKNPRNERALFFLGLQRMQTGRPAEAAAAWEKLLPLLDASTGAALMPQLQEARAQAGLPPLPPSAVPAGTGLSIEVRLDPALAGKVAPGDVLYVFARGLEGRGPPLAVKRIELEGFPVRVQLGDADSPMPTAKLSSQQSVLLVARISKSGNVAAASGDIESEPREVRTDEHSQIVLVADRPVP